MSLVTSFSLWNPTDQACIESWQSYKFAHASWIETQTFPSVVFPFPKTSRLRQQFGSGELYTECDGIPRWRFHGSPTLTTSTTVMITEIHTGITRNPDYNSTNAPKKPSCVIPIDHCNEYRSTYIKERMESGQEEFDMSKSISSDVSACALSVVMNQCSLMAAAEVVLIYWPPAVTSRNICAANGHGTALTLTQTGHRPSVVTTDAITFRGLEIEEVRPDCTSTA